MNRLIVGIVVGWLAARWYYLPEAQPDLAEAERRARTVGHRARRALRESRDVAQELGEEVRAAAKIEKNSLTDKMRRISNAATE